MYLLDIDDIAIDINSEPSGKIALFQAVIYDALLEGVTFCKDSSNNPIWYEREPILDVDSDFFDNEEDYLCTHKALASISPPSSPPGEDVVGEVNTIKMVLAIAFIRCVAEENADRCSVSPDVDALLVSHLLRMRTLIVARLSRLNITQSSTVYHFSNS